MNMLPNEAMKFIEDLAPLVKETENEVILCVPYTDLFYALLTVQGTNIKIGAQNMHFEEKGAYTGEVSGKMLKSINVEYVIIGHSERRQYFNETDETVNKKIKAAFENGLKPIVCVGETLEEREAGITLTLIKKQIVSALKYVSPENAQRCIIAYEPIWAIGTGKTATFEQAEEVCACIRETVKAMFDEATSDAVRIQYGGSVKPATIDGLMQKPNVDGALVGGASLKAADFSAIVNFK